MRAVPKWERSTLHHPLSYTRLRSWVGGWRNRALFKDLEHYVMFTGYPRSGHSLIGSLLDAHPEMVVSNQLNALDFFEHDYAKRQIAYLILHNSRREASQGRSNSQYDNRVPDQWQGRHETIKVIGDKRGGSSAAKLGDLSDFGLLNKVERTMGIPLKILHVVRNPFDNITTMITRTTTNSGRPFTPALWEQKANAYFQKAEANAALIRHGIFAVKTIHQEEFVATPADTLAAICRFVQLEAGQSYLEACGKLVWSAPNRSRSKVDFWNSDRIDRVLERMQNIPFLADYTWES